MEGEQGGCGWCWVGVGGDGLDGAIDGVTEWKCIAKVMLRHIKELC